jgi:hypothetical protein
MYFSNPYFLIGLIALVLPVIIHLFNFRRYKIFYFSNTRFLQELKQQTNKQSKIRKLIILSLRMLAITTLVFAFARPYIRRNDAPLMGSSACVALYIDNSFSMENTAVNGNLLDEAKQKALSIVNAYRGSDKYMLITNDLKAKHQQFLSRDDFKDALESVQISAATKDISEIYAYCLRDMNRQNTAAKFLYLISDYQTSTSSLNNLQLDNGLSTYIIPLQANKISNVYIDTLWLNSPSPKFGQQASIHAVIRNISDNDVEKLPVKLFINNSQKALASIDIAKNGFGEVQLNFMTGNEKIQNGYVEILDYPVVFDDKMYFSLLAADKTHILSIFESSENRYIKALFASDSSVIYQSVGAKNINYSTLKEQNLVIFEQNENISSGLVQELVQYVKQGGNLLLLPSPHATSYNNTLNTALYVSTFGNLNTSKTAVSSLNLQHSLYKNVFEKYPENISLPSVFQYFESHKTIINNKEVAIRLENGDDFLVSHRVDEGNVFLLAAGLGDKFSDFQKHAIFVPSLYNMTLGNKQHQIYYNIASTNSIDLPNIYVPSDNILEIKNKKTAFIPEIKRNIQGIQLYVHQQVKDADNYLLWNSDTVLMGLSFNYSRKESDMQFLSVSQIKDYISQHNSNNIKLLDIQNKPNAVIEQQINSYGTPLYALFIILALAALLAEVVLLRIWWGK